MGMDNELDFLVLVVLCGCFAAMHAALWASETNERESAAVKQAKTLYTQSGYKAEQRVPWAPLV